MKALDNDTMIRMMADENLAEWEHDFGVEAGTIQCVLDAAEAGDIELPQVPRHEGARGGDQKARSLITASGDQIIYSTQTIADYLGHNWTQ